MFDTLESQILSVRLIEQSIVKILMVLIVKHLIMKNKIHHTSSRYHHAVDGPMSNAWNAVNVNESSFNYALVKR